jgi:alkanesulfonate monooxygenase SsuD/methylene tetrahydromethanopterin reductase-like flavin-dependent oxidoreductase (luciferase family)
MGRQVNFGLWYDFRNPEPWAMPAERFHARAMEQIVAAEAAGWDSVWLTEHHFIDDGYTPSPLVIAAAIGARTTRMRIGTNLMVLPLHDPVRIAEDAATVSLLTGGRFDLGVGGGYRQVEFDQFGRDVRHRPSLMEEAVEIIRRAWSGEKVDFHGKRFDVNNLRITPAPEHAPKLLLGGLSAPAMARAASIGDGFLSTGGIGHDVYTDAVKAQGRGDGAIYAGHWAIVADDPEREAAKVGPHVLYQTNAYIRWGSFGPPETTPEFPDARSAIAGGLYELWDVETAVRELTALLKAWPQIKDVHFWAKFPGESFEDGWTRVERLMGKVLPRVKAAVGI